MGVAKTSTRFRIALARVRNDGWAIDQSFLKLRIVVVLLALALIAPGMAFAAAPVSASGAWIRWLPGSVPLAGYVTLHNRGAKPLVLVGASSPAFKRVELHRSMTMHGGMETMKPVASVTVPAGGEFRFAPGGYHLMLWRKQPIKTGDKLPVVLRFKNGMHLRVVFAVKGPTQ